MFILRKVEDGHQSNTIVGDSYNFVSKEANPEEFTLAFKSWHGAISVPEEDSETYAFLIYEGGQKIMPLFKKQYNYIMTSDGKTFANITFR